MFNENDNKDELEINIENIEIVDPVLKEWREITASVDVINELLARHDMSIKVEEDPVKKGNVIVSFLKKTGHIAVMVIVIPVLQIQSYFCNLASGLALGWPEILSQMGGIGGFLGNIGMNLSGYLAFVNTGFYKMGDALRSASRGEKGVVLYVMLAGAVAALSIFASNMIGFMSPDGTFWTKHGWDALNTPMAWISSTLLFIISTFPHMFFAQRIANDIRSPAETASIRRGLRRLMYKLSTSTSEEAQAFILSFRELVEQLDKFVIQGNDFLEKIKAELTLLEEMHDQLRLLKSTAKGQKIAKKYDRLFLKAFYDFATARDRTLPEKKVLEAIIAQTGKMKKETVFEYYVEHLLTKLTMAGIGISTVLSPVYSIYETFYSIVKNTTGSKMLAAICAAPSLVTGGVAKMAMYAYTWANNIGERLWQIWKIMMWFIRSLSPMAQFTAGLAFLAIMSTVGLSGLCSADTVEKLICAIDGWIAWIIEQAAANCRENFQDYIPIIQYYIWYCVACGAGAVNTLATLLFFIPRVINLVSVHKGVPEFLESDLNDAAATFDSTKAGIEHQAGYSQIARIVNNPDNKQEVNKAFIDLFAATEKPASTFSYKKGAKRTTMFDNVPSYELKEYHPQLNINEIEQDKGQKHRDKYEEIRGPNRSNNNNSNYNYYNSLPSS